MVESTEIPITWKMTKLGDVADYLNGRGFKKSEWESDGSPIIRIQNLNSSKANYNYTTQEFEDRYQVKNGDLLFAWAASLGTYIWKGERAWLNQHIFKIVPRPNCSKFFLFYTLEKTIAEFYAKAHGSGMVHITKRQFEATAIALPPIEEQERIVAKIEELFSELDAGVENLKKAQAQLKTYRQAVLKSAFEGKLSPQRDQRHPDVNLMVDAMKKDRDAELRKAGIKSRQTLPISIQNATLAELSESWTWVSPDDISSPEKYAIGIGPFGSNLKVSDYRETGFPLVFVKNVTRNDFDLDLKFVDDKKFGELVAHSVKPLDLVITKMGDPPGDCEIYPASAQPAVITSDCLKFRIWDRYANRKFYRYCIESVLIRKQLGVITKGVAQKKISLDRFRSIFLPFTSIEEQNIVVEEIESRLSVCDKLEETISTSLKQSEALRQSILKKAFEGKLVRQDAEPKKRQQNEQFERIRILALILQYLSSKGFRPKQMASAKYVYLIERLFGVPIYKEYRRLHLGPYSPEIKKNIFNRMYFSHTSTGIDVLNGDKLFKYPVPNKQLIETAIDEITTTFSKYSRSERSHKVELLATVCKVIEDIGSTEFEGIRESMTNWPIDLKDSKFRNKAEKFDASETKRCIDFIKKKNWDERLLICSSQGHKPDVL